MGSTSTIKVMVDLEDTATKHVGHAWVQVIPSDSVYEDIESKYYSLINTNLQYYPSGSSVDWYKPTTYDGYFLTGDMNYTADYTFTFNNVDMDNSVAGERFKTWYESSPKFNLTTFNDVDLAAFIMDCVGLNITTDDVVSPSSLVNYIQKNLNPDSTVTTIDENTDDEKANLIVYVDKVDFEMPTLDVGHSWVYVDVDSTLLPDNLAEFANKNIGFYPDSYLDNYVSGSLLSWALSKFSGTIFDYLFAGGLVDINDTAHKDKVEFSASFEISLDDAESALQYIYDACDIDSGLENNRYESNYKYYLAGYNCTEFAANVLGAANVGLTSDQIDDVCSPNSLVSLIQDQLSGKYTTPSA